MKNNQETVFKISGQVQGIFYRTHTKEVADRLGLKGYVKNEPDGTVQIVAQGEKDALKKLEKWCWQGPPRAKVENIKVKSQPAKSLYKDFEIRY